MQASIVNILDSQFWVCAVAELIWNNELGQNKYYLSARQVDEIRTGMNDKLHKWEEQSKELISAFIHRFGGDRIEQILATGRERIARAISPTPSRQSHCLIFFIPGESLYVVGTGERRGNIVELRLLEIVPNPKPQIGH